MTAPSLTTGEVAKHCDVTSMTVLNWISKGKLDAHQTPGGHFRIRREDLRSFLKRHNMPVSTEIFPEERRKILIVDDDPSIVRFVLKVLGKRFHQCEFATALSGYEAGFLAATMKPDLVILDIQMPGIDGVEVCRRMKASPELVFAAILVITGFPDDEKVKQILVCGADALLIKPFDGEELISSVESLLSDKQGNLANTATV